MPTRRARRRAAFEAAEPIAVRAEMPPPTIPGSPKPKGPPIPKKAGGAPVIPKTKVKAVVALKSGAKPPMMPGKGPPSIPGGTKCVPRARCSPLTDCP